MASNAQSFHACIEARKAAEAGDAPLPCPIHDVVHGISGKWTPFVLKALDERPHRFGELRRLLSASQRMLTQTLRDLQRDGFVHRDVLPTNPPSVEYSLSPLGLSIMTELRALFRWVERNGDAVTAARRAFDGAPKATSEA